MGKLEVLNKVSLSTQPICSFDWNLYAPWYELRGDVFGRRFRALRLENIYIQANVRRV